jgi:uncharacterized protein YyaL (SSP411 family)
MSRLGDAVSPYLRSHASQPVDWFPWGDEAFEVARQRNVPVLISIGYQTCHWCHVMARESFANAEIAGRINENLVAIKVDREEHPDVDALYMAQAAAFTENLGWPLTIFATPEGATFYAATYLPPQSDHGLPSFPEVIAAVSKAWQEKREDVLESSRSLVEALADHRRASSGTGAMPSTDQLSVIVDAFIAQEDTEHGGFGGAPKFPTTPVVNFLLSEAAASNAEAGALAARLLATYANSPLRDAVEGGFFRYSTMRDFTDPHYERMLFDNAGLLQAYSRIGMTDTAAGIVAFFRNQLFVGGALGSAQDSESIIDGVSSEGGYFARDAKARAQLSPPAIDDKIVTGWNGLALEGLALAHRAGATGDPGPLGLDMAHWLWDNHVREDGSLVRVSRDGVVSTAVATAEDYGGFALGLLELGLALADPDLVAQGRKVLDHYRALPSEATTDPLVVQQGLSGSGDISEGASPSGVALLALAALRLASLTGEGSYREWAVGLVSPFIAHAMAMPLGSGGVLRVVSELARPARDIVVVADHVNDLVLRAQGLWHSAAVVAVVSGAKAQEFVAQGFSLFEGRTDGSVPVAYLCEGGVCRMPITTIEQLEVHLAG